MINLLLLLSALLTLHRWLLEPLMSGCEALLDLRSLPWLLLVAAIWLLAADER